MKTFRLYKRDNAGKEMSPDADGYRDRPFHFKFEFRGQQYPRCLDTNDAKLALTYARAKYKEITEAAIRGEHQRISATKTRQAVAATLGELLDSYADAPVDAVEFTRTGNVNALLNILMRVHCPETRANGVTGRGIPLPGDPRAAAKLRLKATRYPDLLTPETAARYFALVSKQEYPTQTAQLSAKRTANSMWLCASSVLAPKALAYYKTLGQYHDCLPAFLEAGQLNRFSKLPKVQYNQPSETLIASTLAAWELSEDRNLFLAIGHELAFGLRVGEVGQARWNWWTSRHNYPVLDGEAHVKNHTGLIQVRGLDPWFTILRTRALAKGWMPATPNDAFIIAGSDHYRADGIERQVSAWMRSQGWQTQKTNHALRAYAGSQLAMKYGIYEAQTWLRHSSVKVTESHYAHFVRKFKPDDLDKLPARWATNDQPAALAHLLARSA